MQQFKPSNDTGIKRLRYALKYSLQGLAATYRSEAAFRDECKLGVVLLPLSFWIADNVVEWLLLVLTFVLILITEIINSSIEAAVDRFGGEQHDLSGKAKDAGSAGVFVAMILAGLTWLAIAFF